MVNFNNIREIDLHDYLPKALKDVKEFKAIADVETDAIASIWDACNGAMNDQFISESTVNGISRREKMLGIVPYATDTLDDRRFRVASYYSSDVPYTRPKLKQMLTALCGEAGYTLTFGAHTADVKVALGVAKQVDVVIELLERVLPANMVYTVQLMYNTWAHANLKTWGNVATLTWQQFKEDV